MSVPFHLYLRLWRERWKLSEDHAADLLNTLPYNISRAEEGTLLHARAEALLERLAHVHKMMEQNRCVIRRTRLKDLPRSQVAAPTPTSTRHSVRAKIRGCVMHDRDMLFVVTAPHFVGGFTVYNGEITGVSPEVEALWNGTARWALQECKRLGWQVEHVEDRW